MSKGETVPEDSATEDVINDGRQVEQLAEVLAEEVMKISDGVVLRKRLVSLFEELLELKRRVAGFEAETDETFCIDNVPQDCQEGLETIRYDIRIDSVLGGTVSEKESFLSKNSCFNCKGEHMIIDCPHPRDSVRIARNRREFQALQKDKFGLITSRYHVDESQRFRNLKPGLPSRKLQNALGLRSGCLPSYIYRMRTLGYPPAWLKHAQIYHSGLALYVTGEKIISSSSVRNGEEGEVTGESEQIQYDVSRLQEWPGFNVKPPKQHIEEHRYYGSPKMLPHQDLQSMKERLSGYAQKGYVRGEMQDTNVAKQSESQVPAPGEVPKTPFNTTSPSVVVKKEEGTPIVQLHSPYEELPEPSKWTTNTTDHVFFENLPESTGKYEKMVSLLKRCREVRKNIENAAEINTSLQSPESPPASNETSAAPTATNTTVSSKSPRSEIISPESPPP